MALNYSGHVKSQLRRHNPEIVPVALASFTKPHFPCVKAVKFKDTQIQIRTYNGQFSFGLRRRGVGMVRILKSAAGMVYYMHTKSSFMRMLWTK